MKSGRLALILFATAMPGIAWAHPEAGGHFSLFSGFSHPFLGADHLLAMLMVGIWAAQQQGWKRALPPMGFVGFMAIGSILANMGLQLPHIESGIAVSVLALGLLATFAVRLPAGLSLAVIAAFAAFHGYAHGTELPLMAADWGYMPGYLTATALLHAIGYAASSRMGEQGLAVRTTSGATALAGLVWLLN